MMNQRKQKANQMMSVSGYVSQFEQNKFSVRSQTTPDKFYNVSKTDNGLICECLDHITRKADCKHIKIVLEVIMKNKCYQNNTFRIMERAKVEEEINKVDTEIDELVYKIYGLDEAERKIVEDSIKSR